MLYFSNQELAENYHVSARTVRNWIEAAKNGKLALGLHNIGERSYIANTSRNLRVMDGLVEKGKKYRPHRSQRTVVPQPKFYELYTQEQLYDIVSNLEINHEIPLQYSYFDGGAEYWDNYSNRLAEEESANNLRATVQLLESNSTYLDDLLARYEQVNIVDVGVGNALPVKQFLGHMIDQGKLGRYIAIDISPKMLGIAERNIRQWFGDTIRFEAYNLNVERDRFGNLLADEYIKSDSGKTSNLILFMGGTIQNFKKPGPIFKVIHDSMGVNDFFILQQKLDTASSRRYFDFNASPTASGLAQNHRLIFDLFNIDDSLYTVDMGFDPKLSERYIRVVLKVALSIRFKFKKGERILYFDKGDTIQLWRARQNSVLDVVSQLTENDLYPLQVSQTDDQEYLLAISKIKHD